MSENQSTSVLFYFWYKLQIHVNLKKAGNKHLTGCIRRYNNK